MIRLNKYLIADSDTFEPLVNFDHGIFKELKLKIMKTVEKALDDKIDYLLNVLAEADDKNKFTSELSDNVERCISNFEKLDLSQPTIENYHSMCDEIEKIKAEEAEDIEQGADPIKAFLNLPRQEQRKYRKEFFFGASKHLRNYLGVEEDLKDVFERKLWKAITNLD